MVVPWERGQRDAFLSRYPGIPPHSQSAVDFLACTKILHTEPQSIDAIFTSQTQVTLSSTPEITPPASKPISTLDSAFQKLSFADSPQIPHATPSLNPEQPIPGLEKAYASLLEVVTYPLLHSDLVAKMGIEVPKGKESNPCYDNLSMSILIFFENRRSVIWSTRCRQDAACQHHCTGLRSQDGEIDCESRVELVNVALTILIVYHSRTRNIRSIHWRK